MTKYARDGISTGLFLLDTESYFLCEKGNVIQPSEVAGDQVKRSVLKQRFRKSSEETLRMLGRHHNFGIEED